MEGHPVAVAISFTLPAQPSTGSVKYVPLGGDGFVSPFAAYAVRGVGVTGAAGGGSATLTINMDDRFCSLVQYVSWSADQVASADAEYRTRIASLDGNTPILIDVGDVTAIDADISSATISKTWEPTPTILAGGAARAFIEHKFLNVADDTYLLNAMIFLFNIRAREVTPMGPLLWARGSV